MTIEEVDKIINDLRNQIPNLQAQLHQAEGYKQALVDMEKNEPEKKDKNPKPWQKRLQGKLDEKMLYSGNGLMYGKKETWD